MKTKLALFALVATSIVLFPNVVKAEDSSDSTTRSQNPSEFRSELEKKREDAQTTRAQRQEEMQTKREEMKATITQRVGERQRHRTEIAQKHAEQLEIRFGAYDKRLSELSSKIQMKIDELKADGKDVTSAQEKLDSAKSSLEAAKTAGEQAIAAFKAIDPTKYDEQRDQALAARDLANKARESFQAALKDLKNALEAIRALHPVETKAAGTSEQ